MREIRLGQLKPDHECVERAHVRSRLGGLLERVVDGGDGADVASTALAGRHFDVADPVLHPPEHLAQGRPRRLRQIGADPFGIRPSMVKRSMVKRLGCRH